MSTPLLLVTHLYEGIIKDKGKSFIGAECVGTTEGRKGTEYPHSYPTENLGIQ